MNDPPSDVNENIIDIFVLSVSETVTSLFTEHLENKGYRVTLFTDGRYLLQTLREGKPNLLICDTATRDEEGFEVCRQIKADNDLWVIPVLILAKGSSLTDLLRVLDCNADNFITHPFDPAYCISVIDGLLSTPVERQTPEQIKTQFKISHNDQIYVVAANRRKLLEFLLSSFEITVNQSSELSRIKTEFQMLSESAKNLEDRVREQTRVIDGIRDTLRQKEQKLLSLTHQVEEDKKILAQNTETIEHFSEQLEDDKVLLTTFEKNLRESISQREEIESSLQSEITSLRKQISELSAEIDQTKTTLDTVQGELDDEKIHCTSLECTIDLQIQQKELAEKTLHTLTFEYEQLNSALADEESRAVSAETELEKVTEEKTLAENEFTTKISTLTEEIQRQVADLNHIKGELEEQTNQRTGLENILESLQKEKVRSESSLQSSVDSLTQELGDLQAQYDRTSAMLASEQVRTESLIKNLDEVVAEKEKTSGALTTENERLKSALEDERFRASSSEQELHKIIQEKIRAEQELTRSIGDLNTTIKEQTAELSRLKAGLDDESGKRISAENLAGAVRQEKEQAESSLSSAIAALKEQIGELQEKFDHARTALFAEENRTKSLKEHIADIVAEKEKAEEMLMTDRDSYKSTFLRLKHDLDEATAIPATLEKELISAKSQNKALTDELNLAYQGKSQTSQQVHSLMQELEQVKAELVSEKNQHRARSDSHDTDKQNVERLEQDLRTVSDERASLKEIIENERRLRLAADEKIRQAVQKQQLLEQEISAIHGEQAHQEAERSKKIQNLEKEFELVAELQKSLEGQVNNLKTEKAQAENTIQALTNELDQARTALADEWEDHMISVAAAFKERQRLQQGFLPGEAPEAIKEKSTETTEQKANLPIVSESVPPALIKVPESDSQVPMVPEKEPCSDEPDTSISEVSPKVVTEIVNIFSDEDLFETDEPARTKKDPALEQVDSTETVPDRSGKEISDESPDSGKEEEETLSSAEDLTGGEEDERDADISAEGSSKSVSHGVFSFSRKQWFDLVKWARHSDNLSHDQRIQIVRMGRLIQKGRKLTKKQEEQINEMIALVQAMGYRPS
jgi:DNA-binding response OmpR family regulator